MSIVKFATLCDACGARSNEYSAWPVCELCGCDTCYDCDVESERVEADLGQPEETICKDCWGDGLDEY